MQYLKTYPFWILTFIIFTFQSSSAMHVISVSASSYSLKTRVNYKDPDTRFSDKSSIPVSKEKILRNPKPRLEDTSLESRQNIDPYGTIQTHTDDIIPTQLYFSSAISNQ